MNKCKDRKSQIKDVEVVGIGYPVKLPTKEEARKIVEKGKKLRKEFKEIFEK